MMTGRAGPLILLQPLPGATVGLPNRVFSLLDKPAVAPNYRYGATDSMSAGGFSVICSTSIFA